MRLAVMLEISVKAILVAKSTHVLLNHTFWRVMLPEQGTRGNKSKEA